ncbi:Rv0340 family IniB-related protein [Mycolicibacterium smegmatis]|uniref:Rv0340 family IniB-related protein n=1 Tax=Mycolicibacterium smegmatis TaxID=1772 RepID=UPI0005D76B64|nr:IniB N-terminal domain-containing protein [Mycolicibacterium smegmatis]MCP2628375.1 Rv0340 family protein [Mycolicibacterium smegmatis]MDF1902481.1 Rv0340 family protein [Mycolicibacterium smegmatis]MDF1908800.1 Rv0340 family protein [Mycolicibacterium smegmatis]MDF1919168.1 Rv0340 family protein [Mycolicibacterium smegmatis]MDF1927340.1 Rv0340 family protein [Mycolicibacterium smegmatis]
MANTLLDFVMSLVRDPEAAARYAADPAQAIADADLNGVTSVDVDNLIPVVSESLSVGAATGGLDAYGAEPADNVWASGAATAAFDAFGDHVPFETGSGGQVIHAPADPEPAGADALSGPAEAVSATTPEIDPPVVEPLQVEDPVFGTDWGQPVIPEHPDMGDHGDDLSGLDIFD